MSAPKPVYIGPLHLKDFLLPCTSPLEAAIRASVSHSVSTVRSITCPCKECKLEQSIQHQARSADPQVRKTASDRLEKLRKHHRTRISSDSSKRLKAIREAQPDQTPRTLKPCRLFAVDINDEEGVIRGVCRRCHKLFLLFDRTLYWGMRRSSANPPETWPYRCVCGSHSFEIGVGFDYLEDPLDENDFHTITIAVKCCACELIEMLLDEEAG